MGLRLIKAKTANKHDTSLTLKSTDACRKEIGVIHRIN